MTTPKGGSCRLRSSSRGRGSGGAGGGLIHTLLCATLLHPVPCFLTPEALSAAVSWTLYLLAALVYHTAVVTVPLALWLAAITSSGSATAGTTVQLPPALLRVLPALGGLPLPILPSQRVLLAGLPAFLVLLRASERVVRRAASQKAAHAAHALRPEQLEGYYAGWQLPTRPPGEQQGVAADDITTPREAEAQTMQVTGRRPMCSAVWLAGQGGRLQSCSTRVDSSGSF